MNEILKWSERAREFEQYHLSKLKRDRFWSIRRTAKELECSSTQVWKMLYLARGIRAYPDCLDFSNGKAAAKFIEKRDGGIKIAWSQPKTNGHGI